MIEVGNQAGWGRDLCLQLGVPVQIAIPNHDARRWKIVKRKTDRDDALKLAKLSAVNQLSTVQLPDARRSRCACAGVMKALRPESEPGEMRYFCLTSRTAGAVASVKSSTSSPVTVLMS